MVVEGGGVRMENIFMLAAVIIFLSAVVSYTPGVCGFSPFLVLGVSLSDCCQGTLIA